MYQSFSLIVVVQLLHESGGIIGGVVLDYIGRIQVIYFVDVLTELRAGGGLDFLHLLETFRQHKGFLGLVVVLQVLGELVQDILENVWWSLGNEGFKGREVRAHLEDTLQSFLGFLLQIFAGVLELIYSE